MRFSHECKDHPNAEPTSAWNYLGGIDVVCSVCKKVCTPTKTQLEEMRYWQNGENGRTCASLKKLAGNWEEISKEAYFEIEKYNSTITSEASVEASSNVAGFSTVPIGYNQKLGYRKLLLKREGSTSLTIRDKNGYWQVLEYTDHYGSERWSKPVDENKFNVEEHIRLYGVEIHGRVEDIIAGR